ncbi:MAG: DUF6356 family protein [Alphaproteobacteria bacterium]|nr:DUF6356 family protein [Alphaproteobacteria bacterium]
MFDALFLRHPRSVGEGYFKHLSMALGFAGHLAIAAAACFAHALVPALFPRTASRIVVSLHATMLANRRKLQPGAFDYAI